MYLLYKKSLETCLECLNRFKLSQKPALEGKSLTYAGRLDPLARGLILALEEGENEHISVTKQKLMDLPKTYEFEVIFGLGTDSFDQLGLIYPSKEILTWPTLNFDKEMIKSPKMAKLKDEINAENPNLEDINLFFKELLKINADGKIEMHYPFFSSKTVDGKQLFQLTKDLGVKEVAKILPKRMVEIFDIECLGARSIDLGDLVKESIEIAEKIKGDFRQKEIIESWQGFLAKNHADSSLKVLKFHINCGSGFYIRSFACWLGQITGQGAIARDIYRTKIGDFIVS